MKRWNKTNINTRTYWNGIYANDEKREAYARAGTSEALPGTAGNTYRFQRALQEVKRGDRVIDMGCGVGVFTKMVKETYPNNEVWGTDISSVAMEAMSKEHPDIKYLTQTIGYQRDVPDSYFDIVFSGETLEHLDDPNMLFQDAYRVLKEGGKFILTTPNNDQIISPEHTWIFDHEDIEKLYQDNGFANVIFHYLPDMEHLIVIMASGIKGKNG